MLFNKKVLPGNPEKKDGPKKKHHQKRKIIILFLLSFAPYYVPTFAQFSRERKKYIYIKNIKKSKRKINLILI